MMRQIVIGLAAGIAAIVVMMIARGARPWGSTEPRVDRSYTMTLAPHGAFPVVRATTQPMGLDTVLSDFRCDDLPLEKALNKLAEESKLNLVISWPALEATGINRDERVTMHLRNVPSLRALEAMFVRFEPTMKLRYVIEDGVITLGTQETIGLRTYLQIYDVRDLILADAYHQRRVDEAAGQDSRHALAAPGDISEVLQKMIDVTSWRDNGGSEGFMTEFCGRLIVEQTAENHQKIEIALAALRGGKPKLREMDPRIVKPLGPPRLEE